MPRLSKNAYVFDKGSPSTLAGIYTPTVCHKSHADNRVELGNLCKCFLPIPAYIDTLPDYHSILSLNGNSLDTWLKQLRWWVTASWTPYLSNWLITLWTEETVPPLLANALEARVAITVLASGKWDTFVALVPVIAQFADTLAWPITVSLEWVASRPAFRYVAQIARPSWQTLYFAVVGADVVWVVVVSSGDFAGLKYTMETLLE